MKSDEDIALTKLHKKQRWFLFASVGAILFLAYLALHTDAAGQTEIAIETNTNVENVLPFAPSTERTAYLTRTKEILDGESISKLEVIEMRNLYEEAQESELERITIALKKKASKKIYDNL